MKKFLLPLGLMAMTLPAFAIVENSKYADYEGLTCTNLYNISRAYSQDEFNATPMAEFNNKTRSMVAQNGKLYIAESRNMAEGEEDTNDYAHLIVIDQVSGNIEGRVQLTVGGNPIKGLLCANQLGIDDFGNFWLIGLTGSTELTPWRLYHIKDVKTGDSELIAELTLPEDEAEAYGRHDYYDLVGDVTGKEAGTVVMSPVAGGTAPFVVGFAREQGSDNWGPHMGDYYSATMVETYPADQTTWNGAPMIRIIRDEDHSGNMFYVDAFVTYPTLYNVEGTMIDSFVGAAELAPQANSNGVIEFTLAGHDMMAFTYTDYDKGVGTQVRVVELGLNQAFDGMQLAWDLPENGLGTVSDSGSRMMGMCPVNVTDAKGKEGCYLSLYKCNGGLSTYLLAEPGFEAGVNDVIADAVSESAAVEYFNVQGQRVANPAAGQLVIKRQGSNVTKKLVK